MMSCFVRALLSLTVVGSVSALRRHSKASRSKAAALDQQKLASSTEFFPGFPGFDEGGGGGFPGLDLGGGGGSGVDCDALFMKWAMEQSSLGGCCTANCDAEEGDEPGKQNDEACLCALPFDDYAATAKSLASSCAPGGMGLIYSGSYAFMKQSKRMCENGGFDGSEMLQANLHNSKMILASSTKPGSLQELAANKKFFPGLDLGGGGGFPGFDLGGGYDYESDGGGSGVDCDALVMKWAIQQSSLGGCCTANCDAEEGDERQIDTACLCALPFDDYAATAQSLASSCAPGGMGLIYSTTYASMKQNKRMCENGGWDASEMLQADLHNSKMMLARLSRTTTTRSKNNPSVLCQGCIISLTCYKKSCEEYCNHIMDTPCTWRRAKCNGLAVSGSGRCDCSKCPGQKKSLL